MLLLLFRLTTPVDQPGQQDASDVKQQKDFHGAHRRAGQGQRGAKRFWNKEAAHSANSGDKTERGGGIRHRFALRLLIAPAAQFDVVERDLTEDHRNHLEGRTAAETRCQKQAHKNKIERS